MLSLVGYLDKQAMTGQKTRVLLVEDAETAAHAFESIAKKMPDVAIETVARASDIASKTFDILVLDLSLPDSEPPDSVKLVEKYKADGHQVVIYTGNPDAEVISKCYQAGACAVVGKTIDASVRGALRIAIERQREAEYQGALKDFHATAKQIRG